MTKLILAFRYFAKVSKNWDSRGETFMSVAEYIMYIIWPQNTRDIRDGLSIQNLYNYIIKYTQFI
jgi:hypothetical protein